MDIYLVNSGRCDFYDPPTSVAQRALPQQSRRYIHGCDPEGWSRRRRVRQGVAVGDYDGDGFPDLYVTQYGKSILYHNNGDGTFMDVTEKAGVAAPGWAPARSGSTMTTMDGWICSSASLWTLTSRSFTAARPAIGLSHYCIPRIFGMPSWLFHNNGDGTFTDVSQKSGIARHPGKAWGVVATDVNNDG